MALKRIHSRQDKFNQASSFQNVRSNRMDPQILNALIFDYLNKKDKVLAQTLKTKLKTVSRS